MIDKMFVVRHGFRKAWDDEIWFDSSKSVTGIPKDDPLNGSGELQARELANHLSNLPLDERPTAIFSSPYIRCLQTAHPVSLSLGLPIYIEHGLSEWRSKILRCGLHPPHVLASELKLHFPEIDTTWSSVWYPSRNGENVEHIHARMDDFTRVFIPEVERRLPVESHARIMLVSHAAPIIGLVRSILQDPTIPIRPGCCSLTEFVREEGGSWMVQSLDASAYLSQAEKRRQWGFQDHSPDYGKDHPNLSEIELDQTAGSSINIRH